MVVTPEQVREALRAVTDPEIPIDVVELGLIYDVRVDDDRIEIDMTLTSMGCPCQDLIVDDVRSAVEALDGVRDVDVNVVWDPPWQHAMVGNDGRRHLPVIGIGI